jgi:hypothetical protein
MASTNQDFITYSGDAVSPVFTVLGSTGLPVDISTVTQITWFVRRDLSTAPALTKTKSGGGITFVTNGTDGKFQVNLLVADTTPLTGNYIHFASITDASGNVTTVTAGQMNVGPAPQWTYDPGQVGSSNRHTIRRLIGDTQKNDQFLFDAEIDWANSTYSNVWLAGAECCRWIAAKFSRDIDTVQGELRTLYSSRQKAYRQRAFELMEVGMARGGAFVYAGGISQEDKNQQVLDSDRVVPQFNLAMMDNLIPLSPVGHENPGSPSNEGIIIGSEGNVGP